MNYCSLFLLAGLCFGQVPSPQSAREAYEFVNGRRGEARKLVARGDKDGIESAIQVLKEALTYLDRPLIRDLSSGYRYLESRRANIYIDLAELHSLRGEDRECLEYLRQCLVLAPDHKVAKYLESAKTLNRLHDNAEFNDIMRRFREFEYFWDSKALSTPFRENIPDDEKLAGLAKLWSEVKYNFGFPDKLLAVNWDKLYLENIPRVLATKSTAGYYRELQALCARLTDGHTAVFPPWNLDIWAAPPLLTRLLEGRVIILEVLSPSLEARGISAGMEIAAIDGEPAVAYAKREIAPYESASTQQDLENRVFSRNLLRGRSGQPLRLTLRDVSGREVEKLVPRTGFTDLRVRPGFEWRMLRNNFAYVAINRFDNAQAVKQFAEAFPKIGQTSALILDLRRNGGGSSGNAFAILQYLLLEPVLGQRQVMRSYNPTFRAREGVVIGVLEQPGFLIKPREGVRYGNPVVVLISAATYSAAEDFLVAWQTSGRGKMIGEPSGGSTGQPVMTTLPGGGTARICSKRDTFADGREWEGVGIQPDILVRPTVADVVAGRDAVLERAVEYLKTVVPATSAAVPGRRRRAE